MTDLQSLLALAPPSGEAGWLVQRRAAARARGAELGLPTRRLEEWRFTNLRTLEQRLYAPAAAPGAIDATALAAYEMDARNARLVFVDGRLAPAHSRLAGLDACLTSLAARLVDAPRWLVDSLAVEEGRGGQSLAALNAALFADGVVLDVPAGAVIERPIEIVHWGTGGQASAHPRAVVRLGAGAQASLVEIFAGSGAYWTNSVATLSLAEGARLRHARLIDDAREAVNTALVRATAGARAHYESFTLVLGGLLSRSDLLVGLAGEKASCAVDGAYLLRGSSEATIATLIDHQAPGTTTREVFKGVVDERAHGVFQGKIAVRPAAQQTDAHQLNRNLLLSRTAAVDTKPELEIFADDVKCSHGATVGDLDEAALFYLRTRGIEAAEARRMLIEAFAAEAVELVEDSAVQAYLRRHLERWLAYRKD